jgi:hypothetical protein
MPKASAADAATPQPAPDAQAADPVATQPPDTSTTPPAEPATPEPAITGRWGYVSDDPLIYTAVPVTPARGDVVAWPDVPPAADGRWKATDAEVTRWPDNHPKTIAATEAAQIAGRAGAQPADAPKEG